MSGERSASTASPTLIGLAQPQRLKSVDGRGGVVGGVFKLAEGVGFEPTRACTLAVFKTTAIDHSAIPPAIINDTCA